MCISGSPSYAKRIEFPILHRIASQPNPIGPIGSDCAPAIGSKQRVRERERGRDRVLERGGGGGGDGRCVRVRVCI